MFKVGDMAETSVKNHSLFEVEIIGVKPIMVGEDIIYYLTKIINLNMTSFGFYLSEELLGEIEKANKMSINKENAGEIVIWRSGKNLTLVNRPFINPLPTINSMDDIEKERIKQGRWLSGVDKYSDGNYNRPLNSPYKFL